jgi:hypothetical protein
LTPYAKAVTFPLNEKSQGLIGPKRLSGGVTSAARR